MPDHGYCPECGATLEAEAGFCTECGVEIEAPGRRFERAQIEQVDDVDDLEDGEPKEGFVLGAYVLAIASLVLWPLGFVAVGLAWSAHRAGNGSALRAMAIAGALTVAGIAINFGLLWYCQGPGSGAAFCEPVEGFR